MYCLSVCVACVLSICYVSVACCGGSTLASDASLSLSHARLTRWSEVTGSAGSYGDNQPDCLNDQPPLPHPYLAQTLQTHTHTHTPSLCLLILQLFLNYSETH